MRCAGRFGTCFSTCSRWSSYLCSAGRWSARLYIDKNHCGQCDVAADLGAVSAVAAGGHHTCAVRGDGQLSCVGNNHFGQCDVPADLGPVLALAAGGHHTCAVRGDGQLVCILTKITVGSVMCRQMRDLFCQLPQACSYWCSAGRWSARLRGSNLFGQCDVPADLGPVSAVAAGRVHTCAVRGDGQLVYFGSKEHGQ